MYCTVHNETYLCTVLVAAARRASAACGALRRARADGLPPGPRLQSVRARAPVFRDTGAARAPGWARGRARVPRRLRGGDLLPRWQQAAGGQGAQTRGGCARWRLGAVHARADTGVRPALHFKRCAVLHQLFVKNSRKSLATKGDKRRRHKHSRMQGSGLWDNGEAVLRVYFNGTAHHPHFSDLELQYIALPL